MPTKSDNGSKRRVPRSSPQRLTGIRAVAERCGVAVSSVSRVFSPGKPVSARMRRQVLQAAREVGYVPDGIARSLRRGSTSTIGCVVANIANPTFAQIVTGAGQFLQSHGYAMLIANSAAGPKNDAAQVAVLRQHRVDGLLISVVDETNRGIRSSLEQVTTPSVILDRDLPGLEGFGRVLFDHQSGVEAAVSALADLGHRDIAFIGGSAKMRPTRERSKAFLRVCAALSLQGTVHYGAYPDANGEAVTCGLLSHSPAPTALIAGGNQILAGVLRAIRSLDLVIPRDISLITCDEIPLMDALEPKLAVISRDVRSLGHESAEMLLSMINGQPARTKMLPVNFRFGPSCGRPARTTRDAGEPLSTT